MGECPKMGQKQEVLQRVAVPIHGGHSWTSASEFCAARGSALCCAADICDHESGVPFQEVRLQFLRCQKSERAQRRGFSRGRLVIRDAKGTILGTAPWRSTDSCSSTPAASSNATGLHERWAAVLGSRCVVRRPQRLMQGGWACGAVRGGRLMGTGAR
jgi:hypothetical protein